MDDSRGTPIFGNLQRGDIQLVHMCHGQVGIWSSHHELDDSKHQASSVKPPKMRRWPSPKWQHMATYSNVRWPLSGSPRDPHTNLPRNRHGTNAGNQFRDQLRGWPPSNPGGTTTWGSRGSSTIGCGIADRPGPCCVAPEMSGPNGWMVYFMENPWKT